MTTIWPYLCHAWQRSDLTSVMHDNDLTLPVSCMTTIWPYLCHAWQRSDLTSVGSKMAVKTFQKIMVSMLSRKFIFWCFFFPWPYKFFLNLIYYMYISRNLYKKKSSTCTIWKCKFFKIQRFYQYNIVICIKFTFIYTKWNTFVLSCIKFHPS